MNKKLLGLALLILGAGIIILRYPLLVSNGKKVFDFSPNLLSQEKAIVPVKESLVVPGTDEKFEYLARQTSNSCGLQSEAILAFRDEVRLQGSCCSAMDKHRYQEQVQRLKEYLNLDMVPQDPYDIPISFAKKLLDYQNIELTEEQQEVYDQAMNLSHEGGPCCSRCWRWTAFEGQAKYLITQHNWGSNEIAQLWDIEDGCGGAGHEHGHG